MAELSGVLLRTGDQLLIRWNEVLVWISRAEISDELLTTLREQLDTMSKDPNCPEGVAVLLIASNEHELPSPAMRRRIARGLAALGDHVQGVAAAFEGAPPWVSAAGRFIEGILELGPQRFPLKMFADREDAIVWLGEVVHGGDGRPVDTSGLGPLVEEALASMGVPPVPLGSES